ncbi:MAG: hypothetical protein IKB49_02335 [Alphaproteobacteria bacterium]|nr:hypothetical protein [Alphaproteobacteria bacterium]
MEKHQIKTPFLQLLKIIMIYVISNYYFNNLNYFLNFYIPHQKHLLFARQSPTPKPKKPPKTAPPGTKTPANPQKSAIFSIFTGQSRAKTTIFHHFNATHTNSRFCTFSHHQTDHFYTNT